MTDLTFTDVLSAVQETEPGLVFPIAENWTQGRTAYGGFSAGLLLAGARYGRVDLPPLRSALINFTAPVVAPPTIQTEVLRQGRNVTTISSRAEIDGKVVATGTFSFGASQDSHVSLTCPSKPSTPPEETEDFFPPNMTRLPARFFENFDSKLIEGDRPFAGADRGYVRVWARHKDPAARGTIEGLLSIADMLPPAVFSMCKTVGPNSSMTWICNVLTDDLATRDGWYMIESDLSVAHHGYSSHVMRIWNTDGDLIVEGMQSVIIFI